MRPEVGRTPAWSGYFADPFVWRVDGQYLAVGTGAAEADGHARASVFPMLQSADLVEWAPAGHALQRPDPSLGDAYWAPEVARGPDGAWYLYYSVGFGDRLHHLRVARASSPRGPYEDAGPLTEPEHVPFAIDPHPFRDSDGRWYLYHARDFLEDETSDAGPLRTGTALVVTPMTTMTSLGPETHTVARARFDWQRFERDRPMYGGRHDWHTLEGPFVTMHDGRYYCLYSGGRWQDATYGVDYVEAPSPLGPWTDTATETGPRVLRTVPDRLIGPGHCSVVAAPDGLARVLAFHAWDASMSLRQLHLAELSFTPAGPRAAGVA